MTEPTGTLARAGEEPLQKSSYSRLGLVLSVVLPGLGHALLGRGRRGSLWLGALSAIWLVAGLCSAFWLGALVIAGALSVAWYGACIWDGARQQPREQPLRAWGELAAASLVTWLIVPIVVSLMVRGWAIESFRVAGSAMCPTVLADDGVFVDKTAYGGGTPARGDAVLYRTAAASGAQSNFVHRVVAVAGDEVDIDEQSRLRVNGETPKLTKTDELACGGDVFEESLGGTHRIALDPIPKAKPARLRVPDGHLFVLGDNRANSVDSRSVGTVPVDSVQGKVWKRWKHAGGMTWQTVR